MPLYYILVKLLKEVINHSYYILFKEASTYINN